MGYCVQEQWWEAERFRCYFDEPTTRRSLRVTNGPSLAMVGPLATRSAAGPPAPQQCSSYLVPLAVGLIVVATGALAAGILTAISPSTVAGPGAGICLVAAALMTVLSAYRTKPAPTHVPPLGAS